MNRYSCTNLNWYRLSSVCFWRVPAFVFVGVGLLFGGLNPPRVSTGGVTDSLTDTLTQNDHNKDLRASGVPPEE